MRGVVTLAAAAGIPLTTLAGEAFPGRDAIQVVAFTVTIGTLLIQGLTLPWLIGWLKISDPKEDEHHAAQRKVANRIGEVAVQRAMTAYRETHTDPKVHEAVDQMLQRMTQADDADEQVHAQNGALMLELGRVMLEARRSALIVARDERQLDDEVLREVLEGLDLQQAVLANWAANGGRG
jgi:CPA1 family monovalent cation:H+ antiporter